MTHYAVFLAVTERPAAPVLGLTSLAVPAGRLAEAEARAAAALTGLPPAAAWPDLAPAVRRWLVAGVRTVPHYAVDHIEAPVCPAGHPLADCLAALAVNSSLSGIAGRPRTVHLTGGRPPADVAQAPFLADALAVHSAAGARHPALARLTTLLATAAGPSVDGSLPEDQDLYQAFDRFTVGGC
ncbi:hypothetical protein ACIHFE_02805 [Streptomyces sp. NPDC052396]|uniref:hypothetical protein n=1 Tax=Streptomyces sp. NPDC052396 TaxID=3365689 RepID=UPI0037CDF907